MMIWTAPTVNHEHPAQRILRLAIVIRTTHLLPLLCVQLFSAGKILSYSSYP
jgi:hypothetical protein